MSSSRSHAPGHETNHAARPTRLARLGRKKVGVGLVSLLSLTALALPTSAFAAQPPVGLGTADSFAVLAGSTATNTGPSVLNGDLGVSPGSSLTGFTGPPNGTVNGATHDGDAVAASAELALTNAIGDAAGRGPAASVAADLGGRRLTAGVYKGPTLGLTGALTLDAQGNPNAVFIFQAGSTLTTAVGSSVNLINGAQACNVFWEIGSSATLGSASLFTGNILASTSISMDNAVTVHGRALAKTGAVTLINDTITAAHCTTPLTGGSGGSSGGSTGGTSGTPTSGGTPGTATSGTPIGSKSTSAATKRREAKAKARARKARAAARHAPGLGPGLVPAGLALALAGIVRPPDRP